MIKTIATFLFILWLLGVFGMYDFVWPYHALLIASIMLAFIAGVRNRRVEITEIMANCELSRKEAEQVKAIMDKNGLNEQEAVELLEIRSKYHLENDHHLLQTEAEQVRKMVNKNRLSRQEAVELLGVRLKLRPR